MTMTYLPQSSVVHRMQTLLNIIQCLENLKWRKFITELIDSGLLKLIVTLEKILSQGTRVESTGLALLIAYKMFPMSVAHYHP